MTNFLFDIRDDSLVLVQGEEAIRDADWDDLLARVRKIPARRLRALIFSDGGHPNARQRATLKDYTGDDEPKIAVVSASVVVRGASTAISWFNKGIKAFHPTEIASALDHLGVAQGDRRAWLDRANILAAKLAGRIASVPAEG